DFPSAVRTEESEIRRSDVAAVHQQRILRHTDQSAPGAFADKLTGLGVFKHPWHHVAAGAREFVNDHYFGAENRRGGGAVYRAVSRLPPAEQRPVHDFDHVVGDLAAAV